MSGSAEEAGVIRRLPEAVAAQIAAGEVIERPASVVKELVENSCDAGASRIEIEVRDAGLESMRVRDDGRGIGADALALAFERHATSKLRTAADLLALVSYGFRGEALPSIAAAADMECVSRAAGAALGARIRLRAGNAEGVEPAGAPLGTSVEVRDLFGRQPARRRFLASARSERAAIARAVVDAALARPEIAFHLAIEGRTLLRTDGATGNGGLRAACAAVWGAEAAAEALACEGERRAEGGAVMRVSGLLAAPAQAKRRRGGVHLFVNGRPVRSRRLSYALEGAYADLLPGGRYPLAAVFLELPPDALDVNVHPTKAQVKLRDEGAAFGLIQSSARRALLEGLPLPGAASWPDAGTASGFETHWGAAATAGVAFLPEEGLPETGQPEAGRPHPAWTAQASAVVGGQALRDPRADGAPAPRPATGLPLLRLVGQVQDCFLVAEGPQGMVLIDQHAAHERVWYERLLARGTGEAGRQALLEPTLVELTPPQAAALLENEAALAAQGLELEPFGERALRLRALPACLGRAECDPRAALGALLDDLAEGGSVPPRHDPLTASLACHASVRAGQTLQLDEMRALLRDLERCENPHTCPHGRPTLVEFAASELQRRFGRR